MKRGKTNREKLEKTFEKVRLLSLATPKARKSFVCEGNREVIDCISECCANVLKGKVPLTSRQKSDLRKHRDKLRLVAKKKLSLTTKKGIIQKSGFLGSLLVPVAALLGSLLSSKKI